VPCLLFVFVLTICVTVGGCSRSPEHTADGRVVVHYWEKWTGFEGEAMQAVVDDFNASQDGVLVKMLPVSSINEKFMLAVAGGNPPGVVGITAQTLPVFAERGALQPLDRRLEQAGVSESDYLPVYWGVCRHRGFTWALPSVPVTLALHYNRSLFEAAGLDPDRPPTTIDELDAIAERLTVVRVKRGGRWVELPYPELTGQERADKGFSLVQLGYTPAVPGWWDAQWGAWFGGRLIEDSDTITAASPENTAAFSWYASYSEKYGSDTLQKFAQSFGNFSSPQSPFMSGKVAMVLQGVWMHNFIEMYKPGLDWSAAPFPPANQNMGDVTLADADLLAVPRGALNPDAAFEFIRYVNQQKAAEKLAMGQRKFTALRSVSEGFYDAHPNPYIELFARLAQSPNAVAPPKTSVWQAYQSELRVAARSIYSGGTTVDAALEQVRHRAQRLLDRDLERWRRVGEARRAEWESRR